MCLKIVVERWFWELKMLIGSLVKLHAWLHLYLCFSLHKKLFLSNLNNFLTLGYLPNFSTSFYRNLDSFLTARWINRQTFWTLDSWWINRASLLSFLLNCSSTAASAEAYYAWHLLDTSRHLYLSRFTELLYICSVWPVSHFSRSISRQIHLFTSQTLFSLSKPSTHMIFELSLLQITWYALFSF